jgi:hypothetical protein
VLVVAVAVAAFVGLRMEAGSGGGAAAERVPNHQDLDVVNQGFTQLTPDANGNRLFTYAVIVTNPNSEVVARRVSLDVEFLNTAGTVIKAEHPVPFCINTNDQVAAGGSDEAGADIARMQVGIRVGTWKRTTTNGRFSFMDTTTGPLVATTSNDNGDVVEPPAGGLETTTKLLSSYSSSSRKPAVVTAVYYDDTGRIVGGTSQYMTSVPANAWLTLQLTAFTTAPDVARTEIYGAPLQ